MKIFLSGYYGAKNLGDELLLLKVIEDILAIAPQAEFLVWSIDKEFTNRFLKDYPVSAVDRFSPADTVNAVKSSDLVVLGGGGILQEYYGIKIEDLFKDFGYHVVSYAVPPFLGKLFGKKVFYWCLGHGPVVTEEALYFSRWFYSLADCITVRDEASFEEVSSLVSKDKVYLDADPLLHFDFKRWAVEKKEPNILGVAIRKWFFEETLVEKVGRALRRLLSERPDLKIFLIPCDLNLDPAVLGRLQALLPEDRLVRFEIEGIEDIVRAISLCQWFVGMRLHSLICAYKLGLPFLALSYDGKTEEFVKSVGAQSVKVVELTEEELFLKLKVLISSKPLGVREFTYKTPEIFKAFINNEILAEQGELKDVKVDSHTLGYLQDFVKTLLQQREELQTKISSFQRLSEELRSENEELRSKLEELRSENEELRSKLEELRSENEELRSQRDQYFMNLSEIYNSNAWKVVRFYYKLRDTTPLRYLYPFYKPLIDKIFGKKRNFYEIKAKEKEKDEKIEKTLQFIENSENILIMLSAIPFNTIYNQRPLNLSKQFSKLGYKVLFVTWQWSPDEIIPASYEEVYPNILQIPMYDFFSFYQVLYFNSKEKVFYVTFPVESFIPAIREMRKKGFKIVYDIMDDWDGFAEVGQAPWYKKEAEERIILEADFVIAILRSLAEKFAYLRKDIFILPNAYDEEVLGVDAKFIAGTNANDELITIGYYGWLSEGRFDWDFVFKVAKVYERKIKIQLIGYALSDEIRNKLMEFKNIEYIGKVSPRELKQYVSCWHIGIIPFKERKIAKGADPLKLYEYIYFGLPTFIKGIDKELANRPLVFYVDSVEQFESILEKFDSKEKIKDFQQANREFVENFLIRNNWKARAEELINIINKPILWS
ncbi:MAG: polysaccharide pyruvyl transferase family protein [Thermodesulfobacterium sp.]|jgi:polysaccharide pyruvyl transferase CsaB|nr:polysaccharide pyruvyl transferase family protein [Thermodesulfobacterium sp.]